MYDKRKFNKINDKKVLHKVKKQWVTISLALFMMIGGGAVATHVNASADTTTNNQKVVNVQAQNKESTTVTDQASRLHNRLVNNANVQALRLGSHHTKRNNILKNRFKRSNNGKSLKRSGYVNTVKYHGHFVFNKYAPNDKRAVVPKRLNLKRLNWAKGRFGQLNLTLFAHKRYGWNKLSNRSAKKYTKALNSIYKNYKKSKRTNHNKKSHITYISARNYKKLNRQLKKYQYSMRHGYKWNRKYNKKAYYNLKNRMKHLRVRSNKKRNRKNNKKQIKTSRNQGKKKATSSNARQTTPVSFGGNSDANQTNQVNNTSDQPSQNNSASNNQQSQSDQGVNAPSDNPSQPTNSSDTTNSQPSDDSDASDNALTPSQVSTYLDQFKQQTFNDINQDRQANGSPALVESPILDKLSALRAQQLITNYSHINSQGQLYWAIDAPQVGLHLSPSFYFAENIAAGNLGQAGMYGDPKNYDNHNGYDLANMDEDSMMNYDQDQGNGHRKNILSDSPKYVGIGTSYDKNSGTFYVAEDFATSSVPIASDQQAIKNDQQSLNEFHQHEANVTSKLNEIKNNKINMKNQLAKDQQTLNTDEANKSGSQKLQQDQQNVNNDKTNLKKLQNQPVPIDANFQDGQFYESNLQDDEVKLQKDEQYTDLS